MRRAVPDDGLVRLEFAGAAETVTRTGRALDLAPLDPFPAVTVEQVLAAIRRESPAVGPAPPIRIACATPGPGHDDLAVPSRPPRARRTLLAAVARSRGERGSHAEARLGLRAELREAQAAVPESRPPQDPRELRRRVAETGGEVDRLRETVAARRGRLAAEREAGTESAGDRTALSEAVARLSEAETEAAAAAQSLAAAERDARATRDRRERRLRLEDRLANARRADRAELAELARPAVEAALDAAPWPSAGCLPECDRTTLALAAVRAADLDAPVVDATGQFDDAESAAAWLDAPVLRL